MLLQYVLKPSLHSLDRDGSEEGEVRDEEEEEEEEEEPPPKKKKEEPDPKRKKEEPDPLFTRTGQPYTMQHHKLN